MDKAIRAEMVAVHCGHITAAQAGPFVAIQAARDGLMADALLRAAAGAGGKAVLIAGAGHIRTDRGVPWHLARRAYGGRIVILALVEVSADKTTPADYAANYGAHTLPFDFVWFTPRPDRPDPCGRFSR
jgi:uncharacterized iron-regulated protein